MLRSVTPDDLRARYPLYTLKQAEAVELLERGFSERAIARALGISRAGARDRLDAATAHLRRAQPVSEPPQGPSTPPAA